MLALCVWAGRICQPGSKKCATIGVPKGDDRVAFGSHEGAQAALEKEVDCEAQKYGLAGGYRLRRRASPREQR